MRMNRSNLRQLLLGSLDQAAERLARTGLSLDFIKFGIVGSMGFCWDTATVYSLRRFTGLYLAGLAGFIVAASANWAVNRVWTFRHKTQEQLHRQWAKFLIANLAGFTLNRGSFFILITVNTHFRSQPVFAIIFGSLAGLAVNYLLSKRYVFK
jgi:putative flippase GtrA